MLAPEDFAAIQRAKLGDETVATTPDDDQPGAPPLVAPAFNRVKGVRVFDTFIGDGDTDGSLAAGASWLITAPYQPDGWLIACPNIANVELEVTIAPSADRYPHARLGPGGSCLLPGRDVYLTVVNIGSAAVFPVINALTNFGQLDWFINPGPGTMTK